MATWDDVRRIATELPEAVDDPGTDRTTTAWRIGRKAFVWERPLRRGDIEALGAAAPTGPILAARVSDEGAKQALVADAPDIYFTTPHFNGYPAVLVQLDQIDVDELRELMTEAWLARAPKRLARQHGYTD